MVKLDKSLIKYPQAISLFEFCKDALRYRFNDRVRIIDQDVGTLVGFEPADCSHWKRGKKNVRSLVHLKSISKNLEVDEMIPVAVALGEMTAEEATLELKGYISYKLGAEKEHELKKQFFHQPDQWNAPKFEKSFEQVFEVKKNLLAALAKHMLAQANINEAPIDLAKLFKLFPAITLTGNGEIKKGSPFVELVTNDTAKTKAGAYAHGAGAGCTMFYDGDLETPCVRFLLLKNLFAYLYNSSDPMLGELKDIPKEILEEHACVFAMLVLVPEELLPVEIQNLTQEYDIIQQLADSFMVSTSLMNTRLWQLN